MGHEEWIRLMRAERERIEGATVWQRAWWWFSILGRIRIRIVQSLAPSDTAVARARLQSSLEVLDRPRRSSTPQASVLRLVVLDRLINLALGDGDVDNAAAHLDRLDEILVEAEWRAELRWRLIQALRSPGQGDRFLHQAKHYVADDAAEAEYVADILRWYLDIGNAQAAREVANAVASRHATKPIQTMQMLCLAPESLEDANEAARIARRTHPNSLGSRVSDRGRAHVLLAGCAEVAGRDDEMLAQTSAALALERTDEARYWQARALLRLGRSLEACAILDEIPPGATARWHRLTHFARLAARSTLELVEPCVRALCGAWGPPSRLERELAVHVLARVVWADIDDEPGRIKAVAEWSGHIEACIGRLPWCQYNIALSDMLVNGSFARAAERLAAADDVARVRCPVALLRAACATVLARDVELGVALAERWPVSAEFAGDLDCFREVSALFALLRSGDEFPAALPSDLRATPAPLVTAMPILGEIRSLVRHLINEANGVPVEGELPILTHLGPSDWAQWLHERISPNPAKILLQQGPTDDSNGRLAWDRMGWLQDLHYPHAAFPAVSSVALRESLWGRMAALREDLTSLGSSRAAQTHVDGNQLLGDNACPRWPEDHPLQATLRHQARVEWRYLEGRGALRRGEAADALRWFRAASDVVVTGLPGWLVARRFDTMLRYWEGVALARLGTFGDAAATLRTCLTGPMSDDAHAQLGLIAVVTGDLDAAHGHLSQTSTARCDAARHLATVLATDPVDEAEADSATLVTPLYAAAALRRKGAERERNGDRVGAAQDYRQALSLWPADHVAGARLARVWLREAFEKIKRGEDFSPEPALTDYRADAIEVSWSTVSWPTCLPTLHRLLMGGKAPDELDSAPSEESFAQHGEGWALLKLRRLVADGHPERAAMLATRWVDDMPNAVQLRTAAAVLTAAARARAILHDSSDAAARRMAGDSLQELSTLLQDRPDDLQLRFWRQLISFALDPSTAEVDKLYDRTTGIAELSDAQQAFVAVIGLFSSDAERRRTAAAYWAELHAAGAVPESRVRDVASCMAAHAAGNDYDFLDLFAVVDCDPDALPCELAALFVAASEARLRIGAIDAVTHGSIPDDLADLANPDVRNVVGLAYARRAAGAAEHDPRAALDDLEQAIDFIR